MKWLKGYISAKYCFKYCSADAGKIPPPIRTQDIRLVKENKQSCCFHIDATQEWNSDRNSQKLKSHCISQSLMEERQAASLTD
mmetsp:Transcript_14593/g.24121  ORF Transcript_14593/g.24121 Transcript_14593/m.24121 type:complete len:83 (-) Transcript_14593:1928-2176(-)